MKFKLLSVLFFLISSVVCYSNPTQSDTLKINNNWGVNDTLKVPAVLYDGEFIPYRELEEIWVSNMSTRKLEKVKREYYKLRNAVYVTYPYARTAGKVINQINQELEQQSSKKSRKEILKSKEEELRAKFTQPLTNMSVYQGKVLMKILNRQTGNNCYEILKEYKGGFNARVFQTVAFFYGTNLKQDWDPIKNTTDKDINEIIKEINFKWFKTFEDR